MDKLEAIRCEELAPPLGYSHGIVANPGRLLFVAGQIGWDGTGRIVASDLGRQFEQALENFMTVVHKAGGSAEGLSQMTIYVVDKHDYLAHTKEIGLAWRRLVGRRFPAMALVEVKGLLEEGAKVELQGVVSL
ncbi:MAG: RidA family protein [Deltaproteobacteria bacterium]|nr:RidA family protein [Deltaproteobacteria bacterium]